LGKRGDIKKMQRPINVRASIIEPVMPRGETGRISEQNNGKLVLGR